MNPTDLKAETQRPGVSQHPLPPPLPPPTIDTQPPCPLIRTQIQWGTWRMRCRSTCLVRKRQASAWSQLLCLELPPWRPPTCWSRSTAGQATSPTWRPGSPPTRPSSSTTPGLPEPQGILQHLQHSPCLSNPMCTRQVQMLTKQKISQIRNDFLLQNLPSRPFHGLETIPRNAMHHNGPNEPFNVPINNATSIPIKFSLHN